MIGATTHGKGSTSRVRAKHLYDANFDTIRWPSRRPPAHISNKSVTIGPGEDSTGLITCNITPEGFVFHRKHQQQKRL